MTLLDSELLLISDWLNIDNPELIWDRVKRFSPYWLENNLITVDMRKERHTAHCDCDYEHEAEVLYSQDEPVIHCPHTGFTRKVEPRELRLWRFNGAAFAMLLGNVLECRQPPKELIGGRLWNLGLSPHRLGGITRNIFFSIRMSSETEAIYDALPKDGIQALLISGSSRICPSDHFKSDLVFCMPDIVSFRDGTPSLNLDVIESRLGGIPNAEAPKPTSADHSKYVLQMNKELYEYLKSAYSFYTVGEGRNGGKFAPMTLRYMADKLNCAPTTVRNILLKIEGKKEDRKESEETKSYKRRHNLLTNIEKKAYKDIAVRWEATQSRSGILHFGSTYFPSVGG